MRTEQIRAVNRRQRILAAALDVFSRRGYSDAAVDEIALESTTSKGGVYFHFPNKHAIFLALLDQTADLLYSRAEQATLAESEPVAQLDAALWTITRTFENHRSLTRLFLVEARGAGRDINAHMQEIHNRFAELIAQRLDAAVELNVIPPLDTRVAGQAWFGAINEVVVSWVLSDGDEGLAEAYPALRALLLRSVGVPPSEGEV